MDNSKSDFKLLLAPLRGFTDHTFRRVYMEHFGGFDLAIAPFIASKRDHKFKKKYIKDVLPENNAQVPVIPQILSNSSADFIALANFLFDWGHSTVNWNLGCPFPMVAKKGRGSGLLPHTEAIHMFLEEAIPKIRGTMSIKLRLGWKTNEDIFKLVAVFNQYPISEIIIHPRTGLQKYEGDVDLERFDKCSTSFNHPIVFNGDIRTVADFLSLSARFGSVKHWMIGRGCLANPFLPLAIKQPEKRIQDKTDKLIEFHEALFEAYREVLDGPGHVLNKMKGYWQYFSQPFLSYKKELKMIKRAQTPDQYFLSVRELILKGARWDDPFKGYFY